MDSTKKRRPRPQREPSLQFESHIWEFGLSEPGAYRRCQLTKRQRRLSALAVALFARCVWQGNRRRFRQRRRHRKTPVGDEAFASRSAKNTVTSHKPREKCHSDPSKMPPSSESRATRASYPRLPRTCPRGRWRLSLARAARQRQRESPPGRTASSGRPS